ncbi:hypothetical protein RJT34_17924 [Clitoria ternatea]|uniref:Uncharacterized protein n=1 Tax=Clitoria ternatea TaxID=43366 RepID=A0AAN9JBC4_CLITE
MTKRKRNCTALIGRKPNRKFGTYVKRRRLLQSPWHILSSNSLRFSLFSIHFPSNFSPYDSFLTTLSLQSVVHLVNWLYSKLKPYLAGDLHMQASSEGW